MTRALLTEREREVLSGQADDVEHPHQYRSNTRSRVHNRLNQLDKDLEILESHEPELADEIREQVFEGTINHRLDAVLDNIHTELEEIREQIEKEHPE